MGVNTLIKEGVIHKLEYPVKVWDLDDKTWHHNPSICRDDTGTIWLSTRHHDEIPAVRYANIAHPYSHPPSHLKIGKLNEKTLKPMGVKRVVPEKDSPIYIHEKEVEDVRIFWREDGLHGIGAAIDSHSYPGQIRISQVEILIDYEKGTYKMLRDYGYINGRMEKNWSPPSEPTPHFDYIYSPTEIVKDAKVVGIPYDGRTHGGSQLLPYKDGWIRLAHQVEHVRNVTRRWYVSLAELINKEGFVTHQSQFFDLCTGWRPQIRESVEFISGMVWSKDQEELLVSYGLRDETCAFVRLPVDLFKWEPLNSDVIYYSWTFSPGKPPTGPEFHQGKEFYTGTTDYKPAYSRR